MENRIADLIAKYGTRPPAATGVLEQVQGKFGAIFPTDYVRFMAVSDGAVGMFGKRYLALFALNELVAVNQAAQVDLRAPGIVIFASDLGGVSYAFDTRSDTMRIVEVDDEEMCLEEAKLCGSSFEEFLNYVYSTDY